MQEARKTLGLVPWPESVRLGQGKLEIPAKPFISYGPSRKDARFAAHELAKALRQVGKAPQELKGSGSAEGYWLKVSGSSKPPSDKVGSVSRLGDEGYALRVSDDIEIRANTSAGLFYGVQTVAQAIEAGQGIVPRLDIEDRPTIALRAVMTDPARHKEKDEYYFKLIDYIAKYKFNAIFLHLTDDQGSPIELKRHPELVSAHAFTQDTVKSLVEYAAERHVDVIPEIEVWGHAYWITRHERYADITEGVADLCTMNPKTWDLVGEIFDEICALFPSKYVHGGSDEARFGTCPKCKAEIEKNGELSIVGTHLKRTAEIIHERGKIPILWADILVKYPGSEDIVPKYAIMNHWDYNADFPDDPVKYLKSKGFTVIGGSGLVFGSRAVIPMGSSLTNIERWGKVARKHKLPGINNTIWVPQRYVSDTLWLSIALTGEASWSGGEPDRSGATAAFLKLFFGVDAAGDLLEAIGTLHDLPAYVGPHIIDVWANKEEFDELTAPETHSAKEEYLASACRVLDVLKAYSPRVARRKWEYSSLIYAAKMKRHIGERAVAPGRLVADLEKAKRLVAKGKKSGAARLLAAQSRTLAKLAAQEKRMEAATEKYWDKWRYADEVMKADDNQNLLRALRISDTYLKELSARLAQAAQGLAEGVVPDWDQLPAE